MNVQTMTLIFGLLTAIGNIFVLVTIVLWVLGRWIEGARRAFEGLRTAVAGPGLWYAFCIAAVTMFGSLYFSEVVHLAPCTLCWYQRIALYPMVIIMLVAALRRDTEVWRYVVPLLTIGAIISIYHYQLEWFPKQGSLVCDIKVPCSTVWFREFGFMSLPFMALSSALAQMTLALLVREREPAEEPAT